MSSLDWTRSRAAWIVDVVGAVILAGLATTVAFAPSGDRGSMLALVGATAAALVVGRAAGTLHRAIPAAAVLAVGAYVAIESQGDLLDTGPLGGPFGYENATGAFFAQVAFAGVIVAVATRRPPVIAVGALAAAGAAYVAAQASTAAAATLGLAVLLVPALLGPRWARSGVLVACLLFAVVLGTTIVLGATYREGDRAGGLQGALRSALTERRVALWHDALHVLEERPAGVGPGRFDEVPPSLKAVRDVDARWAHNGFLQQGAELGWAGLILTALLFLWGFVRLWFHPDPDAVVAVGAAALAALGIHASVDYVMHFPAVPLAAAVLLGGAQAGSYRTSRGAPIEVREGAIHEEADDIEVVWLP